MPKKKNRIKPPPLSEIAYQKIKELIVTLKLGPMDQVDEEWLAEELSIGRTPIREALFRLNAENLVEVVRGRGFFVRDITLPIIKDLFEAMLILERSAVALAAKRIRPGRIEDLQRINAGLGGGLGQKELFACDLIEQQVSQHYLPGDGQFIFNFLSWQFTASIPASGLHVLQQGTVLVRHRVSRRVGYQRSPGINRSVQARCRRRSGKRHHRTRQAFSTSC